MQENFEKLSEILKSGFAPLVLKYYPGDALPFQVFLHSCLLGEGSTPEGALTDAVVSGVERRVEYKQRQVPSGLPIAD